MDYLIRGGASDICNLGTSKGNSVLEVIAAVERFTGTPVNKEFAARRPGDPSVLVADFGKAHTLLGWTPRRELSTIVESAVRWHRSPQYQELFRQKLAHEKSR